MNKFLLKTLGLCFVVLAIIGALLPLLPTTPFLLIAAACFAKSSPYFHKKLIDNKVFGPLIINWQKNRSIPKKAKSIALFSIAIAGVYSMLVLEEMLLKLLLLVLLIGPVIFIARLPITNEQ